MELVLFSDFRRGPSNRTLQNQFEGCWKQKRVLIQHLKQKHNVECDKRFSLRDAQANGSSQTPAALFHRHFYGLYGVKL